MITSFPCNLSSSLSADDEVDVEDDDPCEVKPSKSDDSNVVSMRSYDLYITYDRYYQTPRYSLAG